MSVMRVDSAPFNTIRSGSLISLVNLSPRKSFLSCENQQSASWQCCCGITSGVKWPYNI